MQKKKKKKKSDGGDASNKPQRSKPNTKKPHHQKNEWGKIKKRRVRANSSPCMKKGHLRLFNKDISTSTPGVGEGLQKGKTTKSSKESTSVIKSRRNLLQNQSNQ